jgi:hypothetical protein
MGPFHEERAPAFACRSTFGNPPDLRLEGGTLWVAIVIILLLYVVCIYMEPDEAWLSQLRASSQIINRSSRGNVGDGLLDGLDSAIEGDPFCFYYSNVAREHTICRVWGVIDAS